MGSSEVTLEGKSHCLPPVCKGTFWEGKNPGKCPARGKNKHDKDGNIPKENAEGEDRGSGASVGGERRFPAKRGNGRGTAIVSEKGGGGRGSQRKQGGIRRGKLLEQKGDGPGGGTASAEKEKGTPELYSKGWPGRKGVVQRFEKNSLASCDGTVSEKWSGRCWCRGKERAPGKGETSELE